MPYVGKFWRENIGKLNFGEWIVIRQIFALQIFYLTKLILYGESPTFYPPITGTTNINISKTLITKQMCKITVDMFYWLLNIVTSYIL